MTSENSGYSQRESASFDSKMKPLVILKDGIEALKSDITQGSVDMILSDLPSGETRAQFDVKPDLNQLFLAIWYALKIDGAAVLMASSIRLQEVGQPVTRPLQKTEGFWGGTL